MANLKVENGMVSYMMETFDGSYVKGEMTEEAALKMLEEEKKTDASMPGYEIVSGKYRFANEEVAMKLGSTRRKKLEE